MTDLDNALGDISNIRQQMALLARSFAATVRQRSRVQG